MILEAFSAELFKLTRNRWSMFWAFFFLPALMLIVGLIVESYKRTVPMGQMLSSNAPLDAIREGIGTHGSSGAQIFLIIGASILFAGEYRWETWRAMLPRTNRRTAMIAKAMVFALFSAISVLLCAFVSLLVSLYASLGVGANWGSVGFGDVLLSWLAGFGTTMLQVAAIGGFVATVAVFTRSLMTSIIAPVALLIGLDIASAFSLGLDRMRNMAEGGGFGMDTLGAELALYPNLAGQGLRGFANSLADAPNNYAVSFAAWGALFLAMWAVLFFAIALFRFERQDLSRE